MVQPVVPPETARSVTLMKPTIAAVAALTILLAMAFIATADEGTDYSFWSGSHVDTVMDSQYVRDRIRDPQGIHVTDTRIYILAYEDTQRPRAIRAFDRATQMELGDESFALAKENRCPADITSNGTTIWVLDSSCAQLNAHLYPERKFNSGKVYAYNIATMTQDTSKEFRITPFARPSRSEWVPGDLSFGKSICTDGITIWVRTTIEPEPPASVFHTASPPGEVPAAFDAATLARDTTRDIAVNGSGYAFVKGSGYILVEGSGYVFGGAIETDGETIWVAKSGGQWYVNLEAYSIATSARDVSRDFDGFPDFSEGGAGLFGPLSVTSMSLSCNTLYALNHSREEVYTIGHNPPNCEEYNKEVEVPTQRSMDTVRILSLGYWYDYP